MSRWMRGFLALGVLGLSMMAVLAPSAVARSAAQIRPVVICPEATTPGCCGPITSVRSDQPCCPGPATSACCTPLVGSTCCTAVACPTALSIDASPNPAIENSTATITGTLTGGTVAAQTVDLYEEPAGQSSFTDVANTQTSSSGAFAFVRTVTTDVKWYVTMGNVQSSSVTESVLAAVALHTSTVRPAAGAKVTLSGTVAPSHPGERIELQQLRNGRWVTIARPKLSARSGFKVARKMRAHSVGRFRIVFAGDSRNARAVSTVVTIRAR